MRNVVVGHASPFPLSPVSRSDLCATIPGFSMPDTSMSIRGGMRWQFFFLLFVVVVVVVVLVLVLVVDRVKIYRTKDHHPGTRHQN